MGSTTPVKDRPIRVRALLARAAGIEKAMYASIARAIRRRPDIERGGSGHAYRAPVLTILWIFIALSAVELVIVDMIVHRWIFVRIAFLAISIWGLIWMVGLMCSYYMRPHVVGPTGLRVRDGLDLDLRVPWDSIRSVGIAHSTWGEKPPRIQHDGERTTFVQHVLNSTNIEIVLEGPTWISLPGASPKGGEHTVDAIRFWADRPEELLAAVRPFME